MHVKEPDLRLHGNMASMWLSTASHSKRHGHSKPSQPACLVWQALCANCPMRHIADAVRRLVATLGAVLCCAVLCCDMQNWNRSIQGG